MNTLEITGALFGIAGVYLTIKENVWCFPIGIINVVITAWLVIMVNLYADFLQQIVYFVLLIVGWFNWTNKNSTEESTAKISRLSENETWLYISIWIFGTSLMYYILKFYTDAHFPFWDSAGTVLCFIAQWLVAKKKIENWLLWMAANVLYIFIYYYKGMPYYSILTAVYLFLAFNGFNSWTKTLHQNKNSKLSNGNS